MDVEELRSYVRMLKEEGCLSAGLILNGSVRLECHFAPAVPPITKDPDPAVARQFRGPEKLDDPEALFGGDGDLGVVATEYP